MTRFIARGKNPETLLLLALVGLAIAIRWVGFDIATPDFRSFVLPWSQYIAEHGFAALGDDFANYNVPYLYLLAGLTWLEPHVPWSILELVKLSSVAFDVMLAYYAARIVGLRGNPRTALLAGLVVLLLPTVMLNGSWWAQCDTVYSAFTVAGIYYLLRENPWVAAVLFGVAISIKLQAVFLFPVLFVLLLAGRIVKVRHLLVVPAIYVALAVPAWLAGRPFSDLMLIYVHQSGQYGALTLGSPTIYTFIHPGNAILDSVRTAGTLFAVAAVLVFTYVLLLRKITFDARRIVLLAATFSLLVPFLLPGMHERYFMQADALTVIAAFWLPAQLWFLPILEQITSFASYVPYLFLANGNRPVDLRVLSVMMFAALVILAAHLLRRDPAPAPPPAGEVRNESLPKQREPALI
ncbi:glycosyltransferase 87 family protein [Actinoplanes sp. CA-015351]|uniref:glycosyltransferase 87 family protein n=1 Tax=Actinoplanes sp. CA-015351 TaxID=3239897 RepID=UPI003D98F8F0